MLRLREFRTKAFAYDRTTKGWAANAPSEAQRQAMLKLVLELNVAVMELSKAQRDEAGTPTTGYTPPKQQTTPSGRPASRHAEALTPARFRDLESIAGNLSRLSLATLARPSMTPSAPPPPSEARNRQILGPNTSE